ncbi:MAG: hypothetical protein HKN56_10680 [Gammaproteobacteria bacterium]|nr:hypothetical protein [Gammaproteobacteria bacterium]
MQHPASISSPIAIVNAPVFARFVVFGLAIIVCLLPQASEAQVNVLSADRRVEVSASASGITPDGERVDDFEQGLDSSTELSPFGVNFDVSASAPEASASGNASFSESISSLAIQANGAFSIGASASNNGGAGASAGIVFDLSTFYPGVSDQAFTATGTISHSGPGNNVTAVNVFGQGVSVNNDTQAFVLSGYLLPGRLYDIGVGTSSLVNASFFNPAESASGSFTLEVVLATTETDCSNGFDEDGDTLIDDDDPDCAAPPPPEICDNGIDDDLDGDIDGEDFDCFEPIGLQVSCMHEPIYPQDGDEVTITARAIDDNADPVLADTLEIYVNDIATPFQSATSSGGGIGALQATYTATDSQFAYGCRAEESFESAQSWRLEDPILRSVDTGTPANPDWAARAVLYSGPIDEKIDLVFFHDDDEYTGFDDPDFLDDVHYLVSEGMWTIPWFVENQWVFNIWIATADDANASPVPGPPPAGQTNPRCQRVAPSDITDESNTDYAFRDAGAIVHTSACRDNAGAPRLFTVEVGDNRPQVVAHEMGHRPFGMADEYCRVRMGAQVCDGGHFENGPFPNMYEENSGCRDGADERPYDADACRRLDDPAGESWFLGEPDYDPLTDATQVQDLMQSTGFREDPPGSGNLIESKKAGLTEIDRMNWFVEQCVAGEC